MTTRAVRLIAGSFGTFYPGAPITGVPEAILAEWVRDGAAIPEAAVLPPVETAVLRRATASRPRRGPLNPKET